jgi:hypothetical protein
MQFEQAIRALCDGGVDFIVIGGVAGILHGSARTTLDLDVVYSRAPENLARLSRALAPLSPYPRGAPPGLPFRFDERTLRAGLNFTLQTTVGEIDLLGQATGGTYDSILPHSVEHVEGDLRFRCVDLPTLIRLKRAAGRPKDFEAIAELEALLDERGGR